MGGDGMDGLSMGPLVGAIAGWVKRPRGRFCVPGHQGVGPEGLRRLWGDRVFQADLTELAGLDNLAAPAGCIAEAQERAAAYFGAARTWFSVAGATGGVMGAIAAIARDGEKIAIARNAHRSAIAGLIWSGARPVWLEPTIAPGWGFGAGIAPATVAKAIAAHPDLKGVLVVSPTYYGTVAPIAEIADLTRSRGIPLIVDEAHGSHWIAHPDLPTPALAAGADVVIHSLHKTAGALTQSALLHLGKAANNPALGDRLHQALGLLQSSSPSYLLMGSLDGARADLEQHGRDRWADALGLGVEIRDRLRAKIPTVMLLDRAIAPSWNGVMDTDPTRLTLATGPWGWSGYDVDDWLNGQAAIAIELSDPYAISLVITPWSDRAAADRLIDTLTDLAVERSRQPLPPPEIPPFQTPDAPLTPRAATFGPTETVPANRAIGRIAAETLCPYPPGIPAIVPGERIDAPAIAHLRHILSQGGEIVGAQDPTLETLKVVIP